MLPHSEALTMVPIFKDGATFLHIGTILLFLVQNTYEHEDIQIPKSENRIGHLQRHKNIYYVSPNDSH